MCCVVTISCASLVAGRYSLQHGLSPLDLTALRYAVAGLVTLPLFVRLGPADLGGLGWRRGLALGCLAGAPYMVVFFLGLRLSSALHGAVLNLAIAPSVVSLGLVMLGRQRLSAMRAGALTLIIAGVTLATGAVFSLNSDALIGDALLLYTGLSWGTFALLMRIWGLAPLQAVVAVSVVSLAYLPPYLLFGYDGFGSATATHVIAQALYQGLVNSILSLYLLAYAIRQLGALLPSLFLPLVPVGTGLLAMVLLRETPTSSQWAGVGFLFTGMYAAARLNREGN